MSNTIERLIVRRAQQKMALCAVLILAVFCGSSAFASKASANTNDFCGRLIASTPNTISGFNCNGFDSYWTYASASYGGGQTDLQWLRAALVSSPGGIVYGGNYAKGTRVNFVNICYENRFAIFGHGNVGQTDGNASHTISGHVDDSFGHSGCLNRG